MKVVVLDGVTLNPGDLDWGGLEALGEVTVYDRSAAEEVMDRARGADVLLTNKTLLPREVIEALPDLKYIGVLATGCNVVDLEAASARGIPVCNAAGYSSPSVAQMVFAYILHFANRVADHSAGVMKGKWAASKDFSYCDHPQTELAGRVLGIVGLGDIGKRVATIAHAFGMEVIAFTRNPDRPAPEGVRWVDMKRLYAESDYISLHCPLTAQTEKMINRESLSIMKASAILINTGRGPLIDEAAVAEALNSGKLGGAAVDVLKEEPPRYPSPLFTARNCLITPHIAWATRSARQRLMDITVENLRSFKSGTIVSRVNP
ncbi:D-2-hydroxyacid dehydrogenase [Puniceicoccales bacterium CK1056]|uniref:D-2-hydroxyacid dehydrogenase n=1 Tax=Oceanipulchritudo coccoides TaxID=2706888 RepID=A0A6B2M2A9_9BACT|nr:D-2-hydroxyacid dehydrogenase [Oceanipulchritudo coccoides]NDV62873.1 D-2-hydroxyacid dehydrogenase [Oceanipulchritudo coccoides]